MLCTQNERRVTLLLRARSRRAPSSANKHEYLLVESEQSTKAYKEEIKLKRKRNESMIYRSNGRGRACSAGPESLKHLKLPHALDKLMRETQQPNAVGEQEAHKVCTVGQQGAEPCFRVYKRAAQNNRRAATRIVTPAHLTLSRSLAEQVYERTAALPTYNPANKPRTQTHIRSKMCGEVKPKSPQQPSPTGPYYSIARCTSNSQTSMIAKMDMLIVVKGCVL